MPEGEEEGREGAARTRRSGPGGTGEVASRGRTEAGRGGNGRRSGARWGRAGRAMGGSLIQIGGKWEDEGIGLGFGVDRGLRGVG